MKRAAGSASAIGALAWKFKAVLLLAAGKAKFLLFGLSKISTLLSMLASFGVYWAMYGWQFGAGLVLSIFVHEMGHVHELNRYGIKASAPMFIPGFGALISLRQYPRSAREHARVSLAGPLWGFGAALFCYVCWLITGQGIWAVLARTGAVINLFNLIPIWQLDGSHAMRALPRGSRAIIAAFALALFAITHEGMLVLIALVAAYRAWRSQDFEEYDPIALYQFLFLLAALTLLSLTPADHVARGGFGR